MRLKKLKVFGFKSFADVSSIEFIDGITAVVGPNGCGKSNIADAFRWVLGEQSAKSLRGRSMPDVIFAGTTTRKPLNYAEVSLTLSDINGQLPIDYDEVTVTRRLHRSGESEYFINNHIVRYRDIQSLFMDSGIGRSAFSIFEQGKIDQVINLSPLERRSLFEEAAGILRFLQRKRESLRKLEETEQNMERLEDIRQEVVRQVEILGRQADEARLYQAKKGELEALQVAVLCARWSALQQQLTDIQEKELSKSDAIQTCQQTIDEKQLALRGYRETQALTEDKLSIQRQEIVKAQTTIEHATESKRVQKERLDETDLVCQRREKELVDVLAARAERHTEVEVWEERLEDARERLFEAEQRLSGRKQHVGAQEERLTALWQQQQRSQQEQLRYVQAATKAEADLNQALAQQNASQQQLIQCELDQEVLRTRLTGLEAAAEQCGQKMQAVDEGLESVRAKAYELELTSQTAHEQLENQRRQMGSLEKQLTELSTRADVLRQMRDSGEGLGSGCRRLLQESERNDSPLSGKLQPLYSQLASRNLTDQLLSTALQRYADTLVIQSIADLKQVLAFAVKEGLQGFSLLCVELVSGRTHPSGSFERLQAHCSGPLAELFLSDVAVHADASAAIDFLKNYPSVAACTQDGLLFDHKGVAVQADDGARMVFLREAELAQLTEQMQSLTHQLDQAGREVKQSAERVAMLGAEIAALREEQRRGELQVVETNYLWKQTQADLEKTRQENARLEQARKQAADAAQAQLHAIEQLRIHYDAAKALIGSAEGQMGSLEQEAETLQLAIKTERQALQSEEAAFERLSDESRKASHTLSLLAVKEHESQIQEKRLSQEIRQAKEAQERLLGEEQTQDTNLDAVEKRLERLLDAQRQTQDEAAIGRQRLEQGEKELEAELVRLKRREKELQELTIQKAHHSSFLQALATELLESHKLDISYQRHALPTLEIPLPEAEHQVRQLKDVVERGAHVNMTSIEEFEHQKVRADTLEQQLTDLRASQKELQQIISELDGESRRLFSDTFAIIRSKFQEIFQILFRGGEADLQLTDEGDVLSAGIEIVAKPPGKQMRSIHLMSGGEKCLTALALLFALFEVKPAPFCLLDEIDAPLDDSNVDRFASMLRHFVDRCQFIVITHNKCTMAVADVLVGVSMQEKGVSKVLTFDFAKHEAALQSE